MGAQQFIRRAFGKTAKEAFTQAVRDAQYEYGHRGYTGSMAEKRSCRLFKPPKGTRTPTRRLIDYIRKASFQPLRKDTRRDGEREAREDWVKKNVPTNLQSFVMEAASVYYDKWGPAVCIPARPSEEKEYRKQTGRKGEHGTLYWFCGFASC